ncbi:hypothetical protein [Rhodococcus koreensis]|uniref:hypothetical protein n=1 Tax=Rhodococcus koreensis TaxID=99653 RepID=UPI00366F9EE0
MTSTPSDPPVGRPCPQSAPWLAPSERRVAEVCVERPSGGGVVVGRGRRGTGRDVDGDGDPGRARDEPA